MLFFPPGNSLVCSVFIFLVGLLKTTSMMMIVMASIEAPAMSHVNYFIYIILDKFHPLPSTVALKVLEQGVLGRP